ncbi:MAG TPA: transcriptional regulator, partial [Clostridiales bacterium]|nr:transcriptional regulator [Clostridiales bacterium]
MKNRLEEIRRAKGIRQEELAKELEVSRQTIGSL